MSSLSPLSGNPTIPVESKVWDMIFVDAKTKNNKKNTEATGSTPITAKDIDIRDWSYGDRKIVVSKGDRVDISVDDVLVTDMSKPLFRATSATAGDLFKDGAVKLPADTDKDGVLRLANHLEAVIQASTKPFPLPRILNMTASLGVCAAASALGMEKYTVHLYRKCEALLRKDLPTYADLEAITTFKQTHERLFSIVVTNLAVLVREEKIPDPDVFSAYLAENPTLATAITTANDKYAAHVRRMEESEEARARHASSVERNAKKMEDEKAFFTAKAANDAALEQSV
jgi:hypothetical protein